MVGDDILDDVLGAQRAGFKVMKLLFSGHLICLFSINETFARIFNLPKFTFDIF